MFGVCAEVDYGFEVEFLGEAEAVDGGGVVGDAAAVEEALFERGLLAGVCVDCGGDVAEVEDLLVGLVFGRGSGCCHGC